MERKRQAAHRGQRKPKAATRDVLGAPTAQVRIPAKWRAHYNRLIQLREALLSRQATLARDALDEQPSFSTHMADAGTDTFDRDLALGVLSSEQDALYEIDEAMNRIRQGTYGRCELTGKPIEPARLEAIPWTRFRAAAERQLEQAGELKRTRLGPRESVAQTEVAKKPEET